MCYVRRSHKEEARCVTNGGPSADSKRQVRSLNRPISTPFIRRFADGMPRDLPGLNDVERMSILETGDMVYER